jgi:hypothetical protein
MRFAAILGILENDGTSKAEEDHLIIEDASGVTLLLSAHTDYNRDLLNFERSIDPLELCEGSLEQVSKKTYDQLKNSHIQRHRSVFERMDLSLGGEYLDTIPTDVRLQRVQDGHLDNELITIYFHLGRYLLKGSSGFFASLPANLQGVWNPYLEAPWDSDYHTNINLQMNYWPAEVCSLPETIEPYTAFFTRLMEEGKVTARELYGAGGWTFNNHSRHSRTARCCNQNHRKKARAWRRTYGMEPGMDHSLLCPLAGRGESIPECDASPAKINASLPVRYPSSFSDRRELWRNRRNCRDAPAEQGRNH